MHTKHKTRKLITTIFVVIFLVVTLLGNSVVSQELPTVTVIVRGDSIATVESAIAARNGSVTRRLEIINAVIAEVPESELLSLEHSSGISQVTLDRPVKLSRTSQSEIPNADVEFSKAAGINNTWDAGILGQGVTVAILDTGIDPTFATLRRHPDGGGDRLLAYYDAISDKLYKRPFLLKSPRDPNGHGTHLAGIIGNAFYENWDEEYRGVAPDVNLVAVRVLGEEGGGSYADVLTGINWVIQNKE